MKFINNWRIIIILSLTLGLAPFFPEPHFYGKVKWIIGGAEGMKPMDWFDFLMHGFPWFLMARLIILEGYSRIKSSSQNK